MIIGKRVLVCVSENTVEEGRFIELRSKESAYVEFRGAFWEISTKRLVFPDSIHSFKQKTN
jgi:hypothetical protein